MTTEDTVRAARYLTLRDYLRVLRHYRWAILALAAIGAGLGLLDARRQTPVYQATASVAFQTSTRDLNIVGFGTNDVETPAALAATEADTITRPPVIDGVRQLLKPKLSDAQLRGAISAKVSVTSSLLLVQGTSTDKAFANQLANTVAQVVTTLDNKQTRAHFAAAAADVRHRITALQRAPRAEAAAQLPFFADELARLDTLSKVTNTAQIANPATLPTTPISPRTVRSTVLGLLLGLLLAIVVAFFRDSMDRRLRGPRDIESYFDIPVVGHIRDRMLGRIAQPSDVEDRNRAIDLEAFRILRRNLELLDGASPPRSIVVTSGLPDEGKTTVAGSLAFAVASTGRRTLLVDCDLRRRTLSSRLEVEPSPGLSDFLAGDATPSEILRTVEFMDPPDVSTNGSGPAGISHALVCIPAGSATSRAAELLGSDRFAEFMKGTSEAYEFVVLDSSPLLSVADTLELVPYVDAVLVCARELQTTREEAQATKTALMRFPERAMGLVVTGVKPRRDGDVYSYSYNYS
jgi:capsular exopolysaccharide synthesis family protein